MSARLLQLTGTILTLAVCVTSAEAKVRMPAIFSDHMVLQVGRPVPIWGSADAGEKITVSCAGQTKTVEAGRDGKWLVKLEPLKASEAR